MFSVNEMFQMLLCPFHRQWDQEQQETFQCEVPAGWSWNEQQFGAGKKAREVTAILVLLANLDI